MKKQWTVKSAQRTVGERLREALPPVGEDAGGQEDLWPAMLQKLRTASASEPARIRVPWFDWALAGALGVMLAAFPAWIPVLLYYL